MAAAPLRFRCYQCNQLLGVSRSKIGATLRCPKCEAELIVPDPDEVVENAGVATLSPTAQDSADQGIPADLIDIRPEDIRVEPGAARPLPSREPSPSPAVEFRLPPDEPPRPQCPEVPEFGPSIAENLAPGVASRPEEPEPSPEIVVPGLQVGSNRRRLEPTSSVRSRDIVLPRSVVAAWSLFVLIALGLAFLAGLLAGHFLWKVH